MKHEVINGYVESGRLTDFEGQLIVKLGLRKGIAACRLMQEYRGMDHPKMEQMIEKELKERWGLNPVDFDYEDHVFYSEEEDNLCDWKKYGGNWLYWQMFPDWVQGCTAHKLLKIGGQGTVRLKPHTGLAEVGSVNFMGKTFVRTKRKEEWEMEVDGQRMTKIQYANIPTVRGRLFRAFTGR